MKKARLTIPGFSSVRVSTVPLSSKLPLDFFVRVGGKAIRYGATGESLDAERYDRLKKHKVSKVFIREDEEEKYRAFLESTLVEAENNSQLSIQSRSHAVQSSAEAALSDLASEELSEKLYLKSTDIFDRFGTFLKKNDESVQHLLAKGGLKTDDYISHGSHVATFALAMSEELGLAGLNDKQKSLMTGAFMHDLSLEKAGIPRRPAGESFTDPEQEKVWKSHATDVAKELDGKDFVDRLVMDIVLQHEERPSGEGFPRKLKGLEMDPYATVVSFVNLFDRYFGVPGVELNSALKDFSTAAIGQYDLKYLDALKKVLKKLGV